MIVIGQPNMKPLVLLVDSQLTALPCWRRMLGAVPCEPLEAATTANLNQWLNSPRPRVILLNFCGHQDAIRTALLVRDLDQRLPLILVVAQGSEELAVAAFRAGVTDYFHMPGDESALWETLGRLLVPSSGAYPIAAAPQHQEKSFFFVGSTATMAALNTQVARIAASNSKPPRASPSRGRPQRADRCPSHWTAAAINSAAAGGTNRK